MMGLSESACPKNEFTEICTGDMPDMDRAYHNLMNLKKEKK